MIQSESSQRHSLISSRTVRRIAGLVAAAALLLALGAFLLQKVDGLQVVVEATLPPGSFIELSADPSLVHFTAAGPAVTQRQRFVLKLPPQPIVFLRLDPGTLPGTSALHSVEIRQGSTVLQSFSGQDLLGWSRAGIDSARLAGDGSLEVGNRGSDPQLVAPASALAAMRPVAAHRLLARMHRVGSNGFAALLVVAALAFLLASALPWAGGGAALRQLPRQIDLLLPMIAFTVLFAIHARFIPLWDSQWYASCLDTGGRGFELSRSLNCLDHDPYPYMALLLLPQLALGKWYGWVHLVNWACGLGAIVLFRRLFKRVRGPGAPPLDSLLATGLFAVNPLVVISALNLNLDWPLLIAGMGFTLFWIERRPRWAAVFGLLLCFTKITGAALYFGLLFAFAALSPLFPVPTTRREKALLLVPGGAFLAVQAMHRLLEGRAGLPEGVPSASLPTLLFSIDLTNQRFILVMKGITLLSFSWVLLPFIGLALALLIGAIYLAPGLKGRLVSLDRALLPVCAAFFAGVYVASRVFLYFNPRYLLFAHILYLLIGSACLTAVMPRAARIAVGGPLIVLAVICNFVTFDPVARRGLETFRWNHHTLFALGRLDGMDPGRDQLVYSPEIAVVHQLLQDAYQKIRPDPRTLFVSSYFDSDYHFAYVDPRDFSRVAFASQGFPVRHLWLDDALAEKPEQFVLLEEPYFGTAHLADRVPGSYRIVERIPLDRRGYSIEAIRFQRRRDP